VKEMLDQLDTQFKKSVEGELNYFTNLSSVYIQLLFHNAEKKSFILDIETSQVENMHNLKQMNELIALINTPSIPINLSGKKAVGKLGSITSTQDLINDYEELLQNYKLLNNDLENLKQKNLFLSEENLNLKDNNDQLSKQINSMSNQVNSIQSSTNTSSNNYLESLKRLEKDLSETKKNLDAQIAKYHNACNEFDKKLSESTQFKQLKKFLQEKNAIVIDLKKKLAKYEGEES
jgi:hypothetical protein